MNRTKRMDSWKWLLLAGPAIAIALLVAPGLGTYQEGVLPQLLSPDPGGADFPDFAWMARATCAVLLGLTCVIGLGVWYSLLLAWRSDLREFDPSRVTRYRARVWGWRVVLALVFGALFAAAFLFLVSPLGNGTSAAGWVILIALGGVFALLQYGLTVLGARETRRLHAGG